MPAIRAIYDTCHALLLNSMERFGRSARAHARIFKVARTIADLEGRQNILTHHLSKAIQYRILDRKSRTIIFTLVFSLDPEPML